MLDDAEASFREVGMFAVDGGGDIVVCSVVDNAVALASGRWWVDTFMKPRIGRRDVVAVGETVIAGLMVLGLGG